MPRLQQWQEEIPRVVRIAMNLTLPTQGCGHDGLGKVMNLTLQIQRICWQVGSRMSQLVSGRLLYP